MKIVLVPSAVRELRKLPKAAQKMVAGVIQALADDPRPHGAEKLADMPDCFRVRCGDYRVVYALRDKLALVLVVKIGNRREVYARGIKAIKQLIADWERGR
ncbi:MAG: type II toxin-antitoxin system RelE family toxin [Armatimonadota bacterium]